MKVPHTLRQYSETTFENPAPAGFPSSCPTLDISATLDANSQSVLVFRPNGEQVGRMQQSARSGGSNVTATRWKPNGQFIAVAWKDGFVRLMAVETSKSAHNIRVVPAGNTAKIQFLAWTTAQISLEGGIVRSSQKAAVNNSTGANLPREIMFLETDVSLPKLSPLPVTSAGSGEDSLVFTLRSGMDFMFQPFKPLDAESISVMISGLSNGQVHISIHDSLSIGSLAYPADGSPEKKHVIHHASHPASSTHALYFKDSAGSKAVELVPLDLQFIVSSPVNLSLMASKLTNLHKLLRYVRQAILHVQVEYKNSRELQTRFLNSAIETLKEDKDRQQDIVTALYHSMATGNVYPKVREWLMDSLGERGLKRWTKGATSGLDGIRNITQIYLIPALERMAIILSRLKGLALFHHGRHSIGLEPAQIQRLIDTVACILLIANRILMFSMQEAASFAQFMLWLQITLEHLHNRSAADEISEKQVMLDYPKVLLYIVEYLRASPNRHYINADLGDGSLDEVLGQRATDNGEAMIDALNTVIEKVHEADDEDGDEADGVSAEDAKIVQLGHLVGLISRSMDKVLDTVAVAQKRAIRFGETVRIDLDEDISKLDSRIVPGEGNTSTTTYTALLTHDSPDKIVFYRTLLTITNGLSGIPQTQCSSLSLGPGRVVDVCFFDDATLFALVDPQNKAPYAVYTIPLASLHWDFHDLTTTDMDAFPPMPLPPNFQPVAMEVHEQSDVRDQLPARVCLLSKDRLSWRTFALEKSE